MGILPGGGFGEVRFFPYWRERHAADDCEMAAAAAHGGLTLNRSVMLWQRSQAPG
jgi:hypothetical protein